MPRIRSRSRSVTRSCSAIAVDLVAEDGEARHLLGVGHLQRHCLFGEQGRPGSVHAGRAPPSPAGGVQIRPRQAASTGPGSAETSPSTSWRERRGRPPNPMTPRVHFRRGGPADQWPGKDRQLGNPEFSSVPGRRGVQQGTPCTKSLGTSSATTLRRVNSVTGAMSSECGEHPQPFPLFSAHPPSSG